MLTVKVSVPEKKWSPKMICTKNLEQEINWKLLSLFWILFIIASLMAIYYFLIIRWYFLCHVYCIHTAVFLGQCTDRLQLWSHHNFLKRNNNLCIVFKSMLILIECEHKASTLSLFCALHESQLFSINSSKSSNEPLYTRFLLRNCFCFYTFTINIFL